ncbi:phosphoribosylanthranilate isomerase [Salinicola aestuarinus]|uniref:phosphoribosylanthranilate isomerase n=1 Tax=Salinicola aestuarinus TaxID=1949082 RepID=UPI000DA1B2EC|nr:phosphoribosylanthranilate isomerase [Salinicola aestuarinus]
MSRVRIKICGMTRTCDVTAAVDAGADALGFVLWAGSARAISADTLGELAAVASPFVTRVGLFVDPTAAEVEAARDHLDLLQFHGDESPEFCAGFGRPWIKALRMREGIDLPRAAERYAGAGALLLDAFRPGVPGGTGETFDWARIPGDLAKPVILAGGLTPDNVAEAVAQVQPYAVDVSGGVEGQSQVTDGRRGIKDPAAVRAFCEQVRVANAKRSPHHLTTP